MWGTDLPGIDLPNSLESIGAEAFSCCYSLAKIELSENLKYIEEQAFLWCPLYRIALPEGLESIGNYAFTCCFSLRSIELPESVRNIGESVFGRNFVNNNSNIILVRGSYAETYAKENNLTYEYK